MEKGVGWMPSSKGVYYWSGQEALPPFLCDVSSNKRARSFSALLPLFLSPIWRRAGVKPFSLPGLLETERGGRLGWSPSWLESLELGSPLRLVQLCSARLLASRIWRASLGFRGCSNYKAEIVIDHNISPHSWPRQPLSLAPIC